MKCKFEHDGDCCNSGATQYMCKCKQPCDTIMPVSNADRIRAMTDEELANFLAAKFSDLQAQQLFGESPAPTAAALSALASTWYCQWMYWLKQPTDGEDE